MRESAVESAICTYARKHGITPLKLSGQGARGKADRMFMRQGKVVFLEVKAPGKKPTDLQLRFLRQRRDDGFAAGWCDNILEGMLFLRESFQLPE